MEKDFDGWNQQKKLVHEKEFTNYVHEREVWWCSIGVNVGVEEDGKNAHFERPVLIVRKFSKDAVFAAPITTKVKDNPYYFPYKHDGREFALMTSQLRLVSTKRLRRKIYRMDSTIFQSVLTELISVLSRRPPLSREPRRPHGHLFPYSSRRI